MDPNHLHEYLSRFDLVKQIKGPVVDEETAIKWLIDAAFKAGKQMIRTHHKEDIIYFIILAQVLEGHGYQMLWVKHKGVVGATRKGAYHPELIHGATKEVTSRVIEART